jgi:hypothetical protein
MFFLLVPKPPFENPSIRNPVSLSLCASAPPREPSPEKRNPSRSSPSSKKSQHPTRCRPATSGPILPPGPFSLLKTGHRLGIVYK